MDDGRHQFVKSARREWMLMYKAWREQHLDKSKEWRGRRVRGCFKKQPFDDVTEAGRVMSRLPPREGTVLSIYRCELCARLHIGNSRFRYEKQRLPKISCVDACMSVESDLKLGEPSQGAVGRGMVRYGVGSINRKEPVMKQCDSSLISEYLYDDSTWVMAIRFRGTGETRLYAEFPPDLAEEFEAAESKGKFFNARIARKFPVQVETGTVIDVAPAKPVEVDPQMDADIAALEAGWAKDEPTPKMAHISEVANYPDDFDNPMGGSLFGALAAGQRPTTKMANGFDAEQGNTYVDVKREQAMKEPNVTVPVAEPEILSPEQAVAVISPKSPKADALTAEAHRLAGIVIDVKDDATYTQLFDHTAKLTTIRKALFDLIDPYREIAYRAYEAIQTLNKSRLGPPDIAIKGNKQKLLAYEQEQERLKAEAQRLADEAARAAAEVELLKQQEELTMNAVNDALESGDTAAAEQLMVNPIEVPSMPVYAAPVQQYTPPPTKGGSTRKNWKAEIKDKEALILDIAAGIEHFKKHGHLGPHAPDTFIDFNTTAMNSEARSKEAKMVYPGVRVWNDAVKNIKGA